MAKSVLDDLNAAVEEVRKANVPELDRRLRDVEIRLDDLNKQLRPFLNLLRSDSGRSA